MVEMKNVSPVYMKSQHITFWKVSYKIDNPRHKYHVLAQKQLSTSNTNSLFEKDTTQSVENVVTQISVWHWSPWLLPAVLSVKVLHLTTYLTRIDKCCSISKTLYKQWIHIKVFCNKDIGTHSIYLLPIIHCTFF